MNDLAATCRWPLPRPRFWLHYVSQPQSEAEKVGYMKMERTPSHALKVA